MLYLSFVAAAEQIMCKTRRTPLTTVTVQELTMQSRVIC